VVAGASRVVLESVRRTVRLLGEVGVPVLGIVENLGEGASDAVARLAAEQGLPVLGVVPRDETLEGALGDPVRLGATPAVRAVGDALLSAVAPRPR